MRYQIENDYLFVDIDTHGAEVKEVKRKDSDTQYMWYGDPKFWGRTSPVLFPFVGSLKNKEFIHEGKAYPMGQHGFARDMEFTLVENTRNAIEFKLESNEETLKKYPFEFVLRIIYTLDANRLNVRWVVENPSDKEMYFSIGAHPAFLCPVNGEETKAGYKLYFGETASEIHHHGNDVPTGMALREDIVLPLENHRAIITETFFDRCTYMIEESQTGVVGIEEPNGKRIVTVEFDTPLFAIWSPEGKNAPFICIEPWYGRCDAEDFCGELKDREYGNILVQSGVFDKNYTIIFGE